MNEPKSIVEHGYMCPQGLSGPPASHMSCLSIITALPLRGSDFIEALSNENLKFSFSIIEFLLSLDRMIRGILFCPVCLFSALTFTTYEL